MKVLEGSKSYFWIWILVYVSFSSNLINVSCHHHEQNVSFLFPKSPSWSQRIFFQRPVQAVNLLIQSFVKDGHFVLMTSRCSGGFWFWHDMMCIMMCLNFQDGDLQEHKSVHGVMNHDILDILARPISLVMLPYVTLILWYGNIGYSCSKDTQHYMNTTVRL